jgi:hypothetical protein
MFQTGVLALLGLACLASGASVALGQIVIRAPFVRVEIGGGVSVRAPFVNLNTRRTYALPAAPAPVRERVPTPVPDPPPDDSSEPQPVVAPRPLTLSEFARSFKPQEGSYEIVLLNPVTNAPTSVRFSLPAGTPRGVQVLRRELAFDYGAGQWVRILFDRQGARVFSRS